MAETQGPVSKWRKVAAAILDFLTVFFLGGYAIASFTVGKTQTGFQLDGLPALTLFALIIAYFVIGHRYVGGTLWQRLLGAQSRP